LFTGRRIRRSARATGVPDDERAAVTYVPGQPLQISWAINNGVRCRPASHLYFGTTPPSSTTTTTSAAATTTTTTTTDHDDQSRRHDDHEPRWSQLRRPRHNSPVPRRKILNVEGRHPQRPSRDHRRAAHRHVPDHRS
jgi:hypothetical protein